MNNLKDKKGITMITLVVTVIVLAILTGVTVRQITLDNGIVKQAKEVKKDAEVKDLEEQIELAIVQAEGKSEDCTMEDVISRLIQNGVITDASQVNTETGTITIGDYVIEGKLDAYVGLESKKYYGNTSIKETDSKYFIFDLDTTTKTAKITGIKDEYAVKAYYIGSDDIKYEYNCVIKDKDTGEYITDVVLPATITDSGVTYTVTAIGDEAFGNGTAGSWEELYENNEYMFTSFIFPNTIKSIGSYAFAGATKLASISIPNGVTSLEEGTFYGCKSLSSITIPNSVTNIGNHAFDHCTSLSSINIPDSVTSIGDSAFYSCTSLSSINIPDSVTSIGSFAFYNCTNLSSIDIPDTVKSIEDYTFYYCTSLNSITIPSSLTSIGGYSFFRCTSLSSIIIPSSVTRIGRYAFYYCTNLGNINIPNSVASIENFAFYGWTSSQTINCQMASKPSGWTNNWNSVCSATINWGVNM